jgi:hypothetical protein
VEPHLEVGVVRAHGVLDADAGDQLDECLRCLWEVGHVAFGSMSSVCGR